MIPHDTDRTEQIDAIRQLGLAYAEAARRGHAARIYIRHPRDSELQDETFSYVPEAHFRSAYDRLTAHDIESDGGLQIDDPDTDHVYFWYNPAIDSIVQEEVEPYDVRGLFATADDAYRFLDWYAEQYGVVDTSHLELYQAALELDGYGLNHLTADCEDVEESSEQVDFNSFETAPPETEGGDGDAL